MGVHEPRPYTPRVNVPLTPEETAAREVQALEYRAEREREEALRVQDMRLLLAGSGLADVEAAAACRCSCHPRPADRKLHDGGMDCSCQLSPADRQARREDAMRQLQELWDYQAEDDRIEQEMSLATEAAAAAGMEIRSIGGCAPFTLHGVVDGRGVYVRSRHEEYRIEIADGVDKLGDPGDPGYSGTVLVVASGTDDELFGVRSGVHGWANAVAFTADAVRVSLIRSDCVHGTLPAARFCPDCGTRLN